MYMKNVKKKRGTIRLKAKLVRPKSGGIQVRTFRLGEKAP